MRVPTPVLAFATLALGRMRVRVDAVLCGPPPADAPNAGLPHPQMFIQFASALCSGLIAPLRLGSLRIGG